MQIEKLRRKDIKNISQTLSTLFGCEISLKENLANSYFETKTIPVINSNAGWWVNFIKSFEVSVQNRVVIIDKSYRYVQGSIRYTHYDEGRNGLSFYLAQVDSRQVSWGFASSMNQLRKLLA